MLRTPSPLCPVLGRGYRRFASTDEWHTADRKVCIETPTQSAHTLNKKMPHPVSHPAEKEVNDVGVYTCT